MVEVKFPAPQLISTRNKVVDALAPLLEDMSDTRKLNEFLTSIPSSMFLIFILVYVKRNFTNVSYFCTHQLTITYPMVNGYLHILADLNLVKKGKFLHRTHAYSLTEKGIALINYIINFGSFNYGRG